MMTERCCAAGVHAVQDVAGSDDSRRWELWDLVVAGADEVAAVPPLDLLGDETWFTFDSFAAYAERLKRDPSPVNTYALIGHMSLRVEAMNGDTQRAATDREAAHMQTRLRRRWHRAHRASPPVCTIHRI